MSEIKTYNPQRFHYFLAELARLIDQNPSEMQAIDACTLLLGDLVASDDWLPADFAQPHPQYYQQYLLYADPQDRFSVVSFVWGPGQSTPIHDHTVWGLVGMLRGSEMCQSYSRMSDGRWVAAGLQIQMLPGDVEAVSPRLGDVHRVWNALADQVSISIHVYGANIGKVQRSIYYEDGTRKSFVSGYTNVPELFSGLLPDEEAQTAAFNELTVLSAGSAQPVTQAAPIHPLAPASVASSAAEQSQSLAQVQRETTVLQKVVDLQSTNLSIEEQHQLDLAPPSGGDLPRAPARVNASPKSKQLSSDLLATVGPEHMEKSSTPAQAKSRLNALTEQASLRENLASTQQPSLIPQEPAPLPPTPVTHASEGVDVDVDVDVDAGHEPSRAIQMDSERQESVVQSELQELAPQLSAPKAAVSALLPHAGYDSSTGLPLVKPAVVRSSLLTKSEIVLMDAREEDPFAQSHPLFACNMPIGRIEVDAYRRIPRRDTPIIIYDNAEGLAQRAALTLQRLGYTQLYLLEGGLAGWAAAGEELFKDVNVPSKSFGEWVEAHKNTPLLPAQALKSLLDQKADVVVLDARRFDEYQTMSIPGAMSVPGAELVLRARTIAPKPTTRIVVNCAGRTRSIIGAQSLINAGIPNPVCALRNGTIGWMLAGQELAKGEGLVAPEPEPTDLGKAQATALAIAFRSGLKRIDWREYLQLKDDSTRTTYLFDVRTPQEYAVSHLAGALNVPGGQLVQETDHSAPVRGARIVLYDTEGVRAHMSGSWLAQMGWEVYVIKNVVLGDLTPSASLPQAPLVDTISPVQAASAAQVKEWLSNRINLTLVIDVGESAQYVKRHIPGAWWILRSQMQQDFSRVHKANRYVLTCADGMASRYAVEDFKKLVRPGVQVLWLSGGNASWYNAGFSSQQGESYVVSPRIDRYKRPYEGTQNPVQAMQAYLDWEYGLVDQLKRDGTHGFKLI